MRSVTTPFQATVAFIIASTTVTVILNLSRMYHKWNCESSRTQRCNDRERLAVDEALVGPNPEHVAVRVPSRDSERNSCSRMLTSFDAAKNRHQRTSANNKTVTAVLIHGFGCTSLGFHALAQLFQQRLNLNVFRYDRILLVKTKTDSENNISSYACRDATTLAQELHTILQNHSQGISPPYLLIGHSYGGLIAQHFAKLYPTSVQGMVLIDPAHEQQFEQFPWDFSFSFTVLPFVLKLYQKILWTGFLSWLDQWNLFNFPPFFLLDRNDPIRSTAIQLYSDPGVWKRVATELEGCVATFSQMTCSSDNNNVFRKELYAHRIPTSLVIAGNRQYSPTLFPKAITRAFLEMHKDMPAAKVFLATQSDHWVHMQEPKVVLEAVDHVLQKIEA